MTRKFQARMLIGGELVEASDGRRMDSINPADEAVLGSAPLGSARDVEQAVTAAENAWPHWAAQSIDQRIRIMNKLADAILARKSDIAEIESLDTGNLHRAMLDDVERAAARIRYFASLGHSLCGTTYPATPDHIHLTQREPYGTVARIVAFNHPFYFLASRLGAPLIGGNAIVIKSPDQAPLSGGILAEIVREVLPPGLVNILSGTGAITGDALVRDTRIKRIGFVGSVNTALTIQKSTAESSVKVITHELGGKNSMIVLPDADVEFAARQAVKGMNFEWQGQSCGSTSCLLVHESLHDAVLDRVRELVKEIRVGNPFDAQSGMGALISAAHYQKVTSAIQQGIAQGAKLEVGGQRPAGDSFEKGYWVEPTVFSHVEPGSFLATEEIFGPVLSVMKWSKLDEVLAIDHQSALGLTAAIIGKDISTATWLARQLRVGYVWINCVGPHYIGVPCGGYKNSGAGREEGLEEVLSYTEIKAINIATPASL